VRPYPQSSLNDNGGDGFSRFSHFRVFELKPLDIAFKWRGFALWLRLTGI
jgi:hypothetical protein